MTAIALNVILGLCVLSAFISAANPTKVTPKPTGAVMASQVAIGFAVLGLWTWVAFLLGYWQLAAIPALPFAIRVAAVMGGDGK